MIKLLNNLKIENGKLKIIGIFSPYFCVNCFSLLDNGYLCQKCLAEAEFSLGIFCIECGRRRPFNENFLKTCCATSIKSLISFAGYENKALAKLIKLGKFQGYFEVFKFFGGLIAQELMKIKDQLKDFKLVPIPLFKKDENNRGFNQSKVLAQTIKENLGLEISDCLIKIKTNKPQRTLDEKKRAQNIEGVFALKNKPPQKIILIDDIKTTGATLLEAAKILKHSGAKTILALTIAR
jgi:competence protein ComFC